MPLTELRFNAGVNRENTSLTNKGRWYAADKVRFRWGQPEKIGGWAYYTATQFLGVCRWLFNWITLVGNDYMAVGTNLKFYIEWGQGLYDITPLRTTFAAQANIFSFTASSASVKVTIAGHGASIGDFVTFSGVGGGPYAGITAAQLTGNFQVQSVIDVNNFTFNVSSTATATTANTGGAGTLDTIDVNTGEITTGPEITGAPFPDLINGLAISPKGVLFGINTSFGRATQANLITIETRTGKVTNVGALPNDTDALTFGTATVAKDMTSSIMEWRIPVLIALAIFAAVVIFVAMWSSKASR